MAGLLKRRNNIHFLKRFVYKKVVEDTHLKEEAQVRFTDIFKLGQKGRRVFTVGTVCAFEYTFNILDLIGVVGDLMKCIVQYDEERGNRWTAFVAKKIKERERRTIIGHGVGQGLAWLHYTDFLVHVLPELEIKIKESETYKKMDDKKEMPMKLFELIPRKCYVNIPGTDENIKWEEDITIGSMKSTISIYCIQEGTKKYYCVCNCPHVLKTMNNVNDIQMARITRFKYLPWKRNSTEELFTVDAKLVQIMRFYYALSSFLCLQNGFKEKIRLLLFNESEKKPSDVLLNAIKEIIEDNKNVDKINKEDNEKHITQASDVKKENWESKETGNIKIDKKICYVVSEQNNDNGGKESDYVDADIKEDKVIDRSKQKNHSSLMEDKLLSEEERKDDFYDFDIFVTPQKDLDDSDVDNINEELKDKNMKILLEKECAGIDWLTKLKYAATKCRWIVFLGGDDTRTKLFSSHTVADSVKRILESKKVQTVAVLNEKDDLQLRDDLRWVTCINYPKNNETHYFDSLYKVVSGLEIKLDNSTEFYIKPGEVAVGLAWNYAANYLNNILQEMSERETKRKHVERVPLSKIPKLFIIVPESCKTYQFLTDAQLPETNSSKEPDNDTTSRNKKPDDIHLYELFDGEMEPALRRVDLESVDLESVDFRNAKYCVSEYPRPVEQIYQMKNAKLLAEDQMKSEVEIFYKTVDKIMELLLPEKTDDYEFVYYNDKQKLLRKELLARYHNDELLYKHEQLAFSISFF